MNENCDFHCEDTWLPLNREEDHDALLVTREMAIDAGDRNLEGQVYQPMLFPTQFVACPACNELSMINSDLVVDLN